MSDPPASLLTNAQRERIAEDFEGLDNEQTRRDRQRIRERIAAGIHDFRVLAEYPDDQFALAIDGEDDEAFRDTLVDLYLTAERLRELRDYDRESILADVRARSETVEDAADVATAEAVDPTLPSELRREVEQQVEDRLAPDRWDRRATKSLRVAIWSLLPLAAIGIADTYTATNLLHLLWPAVALFVIFAIAGLSSLLLIRGARAMKYVAVPWFERLVREPRTQARELAHDLWTTVRKPAETLRKVWQTL